MPSVPLVMSKQANKTLGENKRDRGREKEGDRHCSRRWHWITRVAEDWQRIIEMSTSKRGPISLCRRDAKARSTASGLRSPERQRESDGDRKTKTRICAGMLPP